MSQKIVALSQKEKKLWPNNVFGEIWAKFGSFDGVNQSIKFFNRPYLLIYWSYRVLLGVILSVSMSSLKWHQTGFCTSKGSGDIKQKTGFFLFFNIALTLYDTEIFNMSNLTLNTDKYFDTFKKLVSCIQTKLQSSVSKTCISLLSINQSFKLANFHTKEGA